jgi:hypothetical protein
MTLFGKILVGFNLAFALLLAAWSFSIYANDIDWSDRKAKGTELAGEYTVHEAQLADAWNGIPPAQARWLTERKKMLDEESRLVADRVWYDKEMKHLLVTATEADPVGQIKVANDDKGSVRKGQILLDAKGFPDLEPAKDSAGKPLQSLAAYNKLDDEILQSLRLVLQKHEGQIKEANELTDKIIGDKDKGIRGLQQRILDEQAKSAETLVEQKLLRPQLINTVVESELILKRKNQMEKRIEELKKVNIASK